MRGHLKEKEMVVAFQEDRIDIPRAPCLGLLLENVSGVAPCLGLLLENMSGVASSTLPGFAPRERT
jgi:hypothetical protein